MNTVGPYHNRQETYTYFSLPFCKGTKKDISHYHETLGEAIQGVELDFSGIDISFKGIVLELFSFYQNPCLVMIWNWDCCEKNENRMCACTFPGQSYVCRMLNNMGVCCGVKHLRKKRFQTSLICVFFLTGFDDIS